MLWRETKAIMKSSVNVSDYISNHRKIIFGERKLVINNNNKKRYVYVCP